MLEWQWLNSLCLLLAAGCMYQEKIHLRLFKVSDSHLSRLTSAVAERWRTEGKDLGVLELVRTRLTRLRRVNWSTPFSAQRW
jgi:hypothetical protein